MIYKKDAWLAAVKQVVTDTKSTTPTAGKITAIAALRYIRDALIDDLFGDESSSSEEDKETTKNIRESFSELIKATNKDGADCGFASNASAAAKAAGFKGTTEAIAELVD